MIWRVVAPGAGSYDHDMVFLETENEANARKRLAQLGGESQIPVRLEHVSCGPLPKRSRSELAKLRATNAQNPGTTLREIPGQWVAQP